MLMSAALAFRADCDNHLQDRNLVLGGRFHFRFAGATKGTKQVAHQIASGDAGALFLHEECATAAAGGVLRCSPWRPWRRQRLRARHCRSREWWQLLCQGNRIL